MHDHYEIFISYARADNRAPAGAEGWITQLRDCLLQDHRRFSTEPLRIFFDRTDIRDMDDWRTRILRGVRDAKVLLVCLSPNYLASPYCRWEWEEYCHRLVHQRIGSDTVAVVWLSTPEGKGDGQDTKWLADITSIQCTDLREWFPHESPGVNEALRLRIATLGDSLWTRIRRARRAAEAPGNVRRSNSHFVGRRKELEELHGKLTVGSLGAITVLHGLGGQGKTELAVAYAQGWSYCYPAGIWMLRAEGRKELLPLLGELAFTPELELHPSKKQKANPAKLGRMVLEELTRRAREADAARLCSEPAREAHLESPAAALLILDNVDTPSLLSAAQLVALRENDRVRILATTRLGRPQLGGARKFLDLLAVDALDVETGLALMREHQPPRDPDGWQPDFASKREESAARALVRELDGFTLAVEQVAVHLGLHPSLTPSAFLKGLRAKGLTRTDEVVSEMRKAGHEGEILHREKQLRLVLQATLDQLGAPAPEPAVGMTLIELVDRQRERAPARTALEFAARLAPDVVPWPWLRELTLQSHPELAEYAEDAPDPWDEIQRQLEGLRMLVQTSAPEYARMHRLISAHLRPPADVGVIQAGLADALDTQLRRFLTARAAALSDSPNPPSPWELDALVTTLPLMLHTGLGRRIAIGLSALARHSAHLGRKVAAYRGLAAAEPILVAAENVTQSLAQRSAKTFPHSHALALDAQYQYAVSCGIRSEVAAARGDLALTEQLRNVAHDILEVLVEDYPENEGWQRDLSVSFEKRGDLALTRGRLDEAASLYTAALRISEQIAANHPDEVAPQDELAESLCKMGDVARAQGKSADARAAYVAALEIRRRLVHAGKTNSTVEHGMCGLLSRLGRQSLQDGQIAEATQRIEESVRIASGLVAADPANMQWKDTLSVCLSLASALAEASGNFERAYEQLQKAAELVAALASRDQLSARAQRRFLEIVVALGELAAKRGDQRVARAHFESALRIAMNDATWSDEPAGWLQKADELERKLAELSKAPS